MLLCPSCHEVNIIKNGKTHYGKQNHLCKECGRQFVLNNTHTICDDRKSIIPTDKHLTGKRFTQIIEGFFAGMRARGQSIRLYAK